MYSVSHSPTSLPPSLSPTPSLPQILKYKISREDLHSAHIEQASLHFTEERVRDMEMQARRLRLHQRTPSVVSDAATSVISDIA